MNTNPPAAPAGRSFVAGEGDFLLDGKPFLIFAGEMHYFRVPRPYWQHRLRCARAMGLNTISTYLPWNLHEASPGAFDFSDNLDVRHYLQLAADEGLKVIFRPGPYICAEWEFGGLPAWLLATVDVKLRCSDPRYVAAVVRYLRRVGDECADLQHHRGGPIILTQVENEYGAFGNDRAYMDAMVAAVRASGFDGQLYTCDWAKPANLRAGEVGGAVTVANFGSRAAEQIAELRRLRPKQPSMCGEFWCGWFDAWGEPRSGSADAGPALAEIEWMVSNNTSFNFYMFHGGTSFGLMAGANHYATYKPTVSSYDYWAPLDEAGRATEKYHALRALLARHAPAGAAPLPDVPSPPLPVIALPPIALTQSAALLENLPAPTRRPQPVPMEALGQAGGLILYRTDIGGLGDDELRVIEPHDYATVFLDGRRVGALDRRRHETTLRLTGVGADTARLDILVDTTGRTNFGHKLIDRKGITDRVEYDGITLMGWDVFSLPLDAAHLASLRWQAAAAAGPAFHRGTFTVDAPGDTFLDFRQWGRGVVWVNGRCLSRFWSIGPQQTVYLPGAWLRAGENEIVVFDATGGERHAIEGLREPILDRVQEEKVAAASG
ncbi:MAG TPA: beta-galactosidase family protein [Tepidisphaeraceae bacterium]|jgi:beta-galactosidase